MHLTEIQRPIVMELPSDPAILFLLRGVVERLTERIGFPREDTDRLVLAIDEACTNVIRHAYGGRVDERMIVTFLVKSETLEVRIRDFGKPTDASICQPRDLCDVRPGGLGTHLIRCAMDEVHYEHPEDGGTLLRLVKYRDRDRD